MIISGLCTRARLDFMMGVHLPADTYRIALLNDMAECGPELITFDGTNEITGVGYDPGGQNLKGYRAQMYDDWACMTFDNPVWPRSTIAASGAVIYNASKANRSLCVLDFEGVNRSKNAPFIVEFPPLGEDALITLR